MSRYQFIEQVAATEQVQVLCRVLAVSTAGFYQWQSWTARPTPNQVWVGDITYLPLVGGHWCYLATWRDTYSRRVVGWHLDQHMPTELVFTALEQALTLRQPAPGLIIHADRSSQYTSSSCRMRLEKAQALASYS